MSNTFQTNFHEVDIPMVTMETLWRERSQTTLVDARSPLEFAEGTIPGAISIPLMSDEHRAHIGTLYKTFGQTHAIAEGYAILKEVWPELTQKLQVLPKDQRLRIFCARGGMRSRIMASIFQTFGYKAECLHGGYKSFRHWNIEQLETVGFDHPLYILHGLTGTGKTQILQQLDNSIDLEELAQHRGSLFGALGRKPVSTKTFQANLLDALERINPHRPVFVEGESRKIGDVEIPPRLFNAMKEGRPLLLKAGLETRIERVAKDYWPTTEPEKEQAIHATKKLTPLLGKKNIAMLSDCIQTGDRHTFIHFLLTEHYDKKYANAMKDYQYHATIDADDEQVAVQQLKALAQFPTESEE